MNTEKKAQKKALKDLVKKYAAEGGEYAKKIREEKDGPSRNLLWIEKRWVGLKARSALLAYGLVRGVPYSAIEPKVKNLASEYSIHVQIKAALGDEGATTWSRERIASWLRPKPVNEEAAA